MKCSTVSLKYMSYFSQSSSLPVLTYFNQRTGLMSHVSRNSWFNFMLFSALMCLISVRLAPSPLGRISRRAVPGSRSCLCLLIWRQLPDLLRMFWQAPSAQLDQMLQVWRQIFPRNSGFLWLESNLFLCEVFRKVSLHSVLGNLDEGF